MNVTLIGKPCVEVARQKRGTHDDLCAGDGLYVHLYGQQLAAT